MNTKSSEISSGLVAVAEVGSGFSLRWTKPDYGGSCRPYDKLVRLSDAEEIISDLQNLVIAENARKQQLEAEVAAKEAEINKLILAIADHVTVRGEKAARIKELEAHTTTLEEVIASQRDDVTRLATEVVDKDDLIEKQSAALKLARQAFLYDGYPCRTDCTCRACKAISAINEVIGE